MGQPGIANHFIVRKLGINPHSLSRNLSAGLDASFRRDSSLHHYDLSGGTLNCYQFPS